MRIEFRLLNCFLLMLPLLLWNIILGPRLTDPRVASDSHSPAWILIAENITRLGVFVLPLLIPLQLKGLSSKAGMAVYAIGTLIYFASWLPFLLAPGSAWSNSTPGLLAPRLTPFLAFLGIALIGQSWAYGALAAVFIFLHTWHGVQNLQ